MLACSTVAVVAASAQQSPIQYAYDELGRLVAVADQDGNVAIYVYDAVGNILSIERVDAANLPGRVAISFVSPAKGKPGTVVSILGKGFGASAPENGVSFNDTPAAVSQASPNRIITTVPPGATTGPITVTAPLGSAASPRPFRVVGALAIAPATAILGTGFTQQFSATEDGTATANVIWAVNGIVGGDTSVGTISSGGLFTAPAVIASPLTITVNATSRDDVAATATATVTLRPPVEAFLTALPLGVQATDAGPRTALALGVGIQRDSVGSGLMVIAPAVGVTPQGPQAFTGMARVSVAVEPLIVSLAPAAAARGAAGLTLTVNGSGLVGVIGLDFLLNNSPDAAITVAGLDASPDGTQATAIVSVGAAAAVGPRVVRIRTSAGATTTVGAGGNVFTVQ